MLIIRSMNMATKYFNETKELWLEMLNLQQVLQTLITNMESREGGGD